MLLCECVLAMTYWILEDNQNYKLDTRLFALQLLTTVNLVILRLDAIVKYKRNYLAETLDFALLFHVGGSVKIEKLKCVFKHVVVLYYLECELPML